MSRVVPLIFIVTMLTCQLSTWVLCEHHLGVLCHWISIKVLKWNWKQNRSTAPCTDSAREIVPFPKASLKWSAKKTACLFNQPFLTSASCCVCVSLSFLQYFKKSDKKELFHTLEQIKNGTLPPLLRNHKETVIVVEFYYTRSRLSHLICDIDGQLPQNISWMEEPAYIP